MGSSSFIIVRWHSTYDKYGAVDGSSTSTYDTHIVPQQKQQNVVRHHEMVSNNLYWFVLLYTKCRGVFFDSLSGI